MDNFKIITQNNILKSFGIEETLEKGKKMPIGTVSNGMKKVAEGKWVPEKTGSKTKNTEESLENTVSQAKKIAEKYNESTFGITDSIKKRIDSGMSHAEALSSYEKTISRDSKNNESSSSNLNSLSLDKLMSSDKELSSFIIDLGRHYEKSDGSFKNYIEDNYDDIQENLERALLKHSDEDTVDEFLTSNNSNKLYNKLVSEIKKWTL